MTDSATEFELFQVDTELLESPVLASRNASKPKSPLEDIKAPQTTQELFDELEVESSQSQTEVPKSSRFSKFTRKIRPARTRLPVC